MQNKSKIVNFHPSKDHLNGFVGYHMRRASKLILSDLAETLSEFSLRMTTYSALTIICENPGLRQSQIALALSIERPNLVVILDELEQFELITRNKVPTDRRAFAFYPTEEGNKICTQSTKAIQSSEEKLLKNFTPEMKADFVHALKLIINKGEHL